MDLLDLDMFGQLDDSCELRRLMPGAPAEDQDDVATMHHVCGLYTVCPGHENRTMFRARRWQVLAGVSQEADKMSESALRYRAVPPPASARPAEMRRSTAEWPSFSNP